MSTKTDDDNSSESDTSVDHGPLMVVSRERRSNAGNRMSKLLALAEADEQEQAIYGDDTWAEQDDDEEFGEEDVDAPDDISLDSSSDEDEAGGDDDAAEEKELKKQEREEKAKARKQKTRSMPLLQSALRKKVKLNHTVETVEATDGSHASTTKNRKKSERVSWLPTPEEGPIRSSNRRATKQNTEATLEALRVREEQAIQIRAAMEAAAKLKEDDKPKQKTQAERLAEAARMEKINSKSLYRWEEAEQKRQAERQAIIDARKNRSIEGPFIRYYSGPAIFEESKFLAVGVRNIEEAMEMRAKREAQKKAEEEKSRIEQVERNEQDSQNHIPEIEQSTQEENTSSEAPKELQLENRPDPITTPPKADDIARQVGPAPVPVSQHPQEPTYSYPNSIMFAPPETPNFLSGITDWANLPGQILPHSEHPVMQNVIAQQTQADPPPPVTPKQLHKAIRNLIVLESFDELDQEDQLAIAKTLLVKQRVLDHRVRQGIKLSSASITFFKFKI
jgi:vacuolar protein sorting-associated protein 72